MDWVHPGSPDLKLEPSGPNPFLPSSGPIPGKYPYQRQSRVAPLRDEGTVGSGQHPPTVAGNPEFVEAGLRKVEPCGTFHRIGPNPGEVDGSPGRIHHAWAAGLPPRISWTKRGIET